MMVWIFADYSHIDWEAFGYMEWQMFCKILYSPSSQWNIHYSLYSVDCSGCGGLQETFYNGLDGVDFSTQFQALVFPSSAEPLQVKMFKSILMKMVWNDVYPILDKNMSDSKLTL